MLEIQIPGLGRQQMEHLLLDFNGTLGFDGRLIAGVKERLAALADRVDIHVVTADTFGDVSRQVEGLPLKLTIMPGFSQDQAKRDYLNTLGAKVTVAIGNGRNDHLMLKHAALGIAVVQEEGASTLCLAAADLICRDIVAALDLLLHPKRLTATLRT